jgi:hypothetical protein
MHCLGQVPCSISVLLQPGACRHVTVGVLQVAPVHMGVHVEPVHGDAGGIETAGMGTGWLIGGGGMGGSGGEGKFSGGAMGNSTFNIGPALQQPCCSEH